MKKITKTKRQSRHARVRAKVNGTTERPRLSIFKSNKFMYAALIDDTNGKTLAQVSDLKAKKVKSDTPFVKVTSANAIGKALAEKAKAAGITKAVFDRGGYRYAGRVQAVADGAREGGLEF